MSSFGPISCAHGLLPDDSSLSESILLSPVLAGREKGLALRTLKLRGKYFHCCSVSLPTLSCREPRS